MAWKHNLLSVKTNVRLSNIFSSRGALEDIGGYICYDEELSNFMISGGINHERYLPLRQVLDFVIGRMPVIILHANDLYIETMIREAWNSLRNIKGDLSSPLWICNNYTPCFEPFYGMSDMQIISVLRLLAAKLNYTVTPRFERVVRAHLSILRELEIPYSLSGLYYLCQFYDIGEFYKNIMALSCGEMAASRIWSDLGINEEENNNQFDLFRSIIHNMADDAKRSGWDIDNIVSEYNCIQAIEKKAILLLSMNDLHSEMLLTYLSEELKVYADVPFFLLIDGIKMIDKNMFEYVCAQNTGCHLGILSENVIAQIGNDENTFFRLAERMDCFVFFKHSIGKTAAVISEVIGRADYTKVETSKGVGRGFFNILPRDQHDDVRYSIENRYRVMPEEIMCLKSDQAIIFDVNLDRIINYN